MKATTFREIPPGELRSAAEMLPALVVHAPIEEVEHLLNATAHSQPENEERVVLVEVNAGIENHAQVALISYDQEPEYVHLFVADRELGSHPSEQLRKIVRRLRLQKFKINWWTRRSDKSWPGNEQDGPFMLPGDDLHAHGGAV
jgi:hypothetical protein